METVAGVDLAWVPGGPSGWCVIQVDHPGAEVVESGVRAWDPERMADEIARTGARVVAVDAPLVVGGSRQAERELGRWFGRYRAGAYLATEAFLGTRLNAGPLLASALAARGYSLDPADAGLCPTAVEVYPHALHVAWFSLAERLAYKRKRGRRVADLRTAIADLERRLHAFALAQGVRPSPALPSGHIATLRGRALKAFEDELDGLACGLAAYLCWRDGVLAPEVFGAAASGYIAVPGLRHAPAFAGRFTSARAPSSP